MSDARVPMLGIEEAKAAAGPAGVPEAMAELNIFRVLLHHPDLAARINDLLGQMLWHPRLDARLRELVIMRVGWVTGSVYEWAQHWRFGPMFGATSDDLRAVRDWEAHDGFGDGERAVLAATDEVLAEGAVSAATWSRCETVLGDPAALVELVVAIASWHLISQVARSIEIPLEHDAEAWPPDGRAPDGGLA